MYIHSSPHNGFGIPAIFQRSFSFLDRVANILQTSHFMKIRQLGAELLNMDRQTYMTQLTVAFCDISNAPKYGASFLQPC